MKRLSALAAVGVVAVLGLLTASHVGQIKVWMKPRLAAADLVLRGRGGIVIIGDSRASQMQADTLCGERLYRVGYSGEGVATIAHKAISLAGLAKPRLVLFVAGVNDARRDRGFNADTWAGAERQVAAAFQRHGAEVRFVSIVPPAATGENGAPLFDLRRIDRMNDLIGGTAGFVDTQAAMTGVDGLLRPAFSRDGVHLSPTGERAWLAAMAREVCPAA